MKREPNTKIQSLGCDPNDCETCRFIENCEAYHDCDQNGHKWESIADGFSYESGHRNYDQCQVCGETRHDF